MSELFAEVKDSMALADITDEEIEKTADWFLAQRITKWDQVKHVSDELLLKYTTYGLICATREYFDRQRSPRKKQKVLSYY